MACLTGACGDGPRAAGDGDSGDCHAKKEGCASDAPAGVWEDLARASGLPTHPTSDFFVFARSACNVDTANYPRDLTELAGGSSLIVVGTIDDVVTEAKPYVTTDEASYMVRYAVGVERLVKGEAAETVLVNEICASGGKVAGLRSTKPDGRFLFFLDGPWPIDPDAEPDPAEELAYGLAWYYLGVVRETASLGVEFAHEPRASPALLGGLNTLEEVIDAL